MCKHCKEPMKVKRPKNHHILNHLSVVNSKAEAAGAFGQPPGEANSELWCFHVWYFFGYPNKHGKMKEWSFLTELPFDQGCWSPNSFKSWFVHPYPNAASPVASWKRGSHPSWGHGDMECNFVNVNSVVGILDPQFLLGYRVPNPKCSWIFGSCIGFFDPKNFHTQHHKNPCVLHRTGTPEQCQTPQTPCPMSLSGEDSPGPTGITNVTSILIFGARIYPTLTQDHASMFQQFIDFV